MSKDTTFVHGTIVQADYLNSDQEADTGLLWGVYLAQGSSASVETRVGGDPNDTQGPMVIGGKRAWKNGASAPAAASGGAGTRDIYVSTDIATLPDYNVEVLDSVPASPYYRKIGSASWDGVSVLNNIKMEHGVQAEANQFNQFTFQSISDSTSDVPLTIAGYLNQNNASSTLISVGSDNGGGYTKYASFLGDGSLSFSPAVATQGVINAALSGDVTSRLVINANGQIAWGSGALARDAFLERSSAGVIKLSDGTAGGNGVLDTVSLQNSDTGGSAYNGAGMVNVLDDLNIQTGHVLRIDGTQFNSSHLADAANVAHLSGTEVFTGAKTFSTNVTTFSAGQAITGTSYLDRQGSSSADTAFAARVGTEANNRFQATVGGTLNWGAGGASPVDVQLSRTAPDVLTMGVGDRIEQSYNASVAEPTVLVNRATLDSALSSGAASAAFSFFLS